MVPFRELHINNNGKYRNCCIQQNTMGKINLKVKDPNLWFQMQQDMVELRADLEQNKRHLNCIKCWKLEDEGLSSYRMNWNNQYISNGDTDLIPRIEVIDLRLGNRCNLKCKMCNSTWSNLISSEVEELKKIGIDNTYTQMPVIGIVKQSDDFMDGLFNFIKRTPTIKEIKLAGGEPFVMSEVEEFIHRLVKENLTNFEISLLTNVTIVKDRIIEDLEKFKSTHIQCSIDGIGKYLEYQRSPSKWEVISRNFERLYNSKLTVNLTPCWSNLNILSVADFLEWTANFPKSHVAYNEVNKPSYLDWRLVPIKERNEVIDKLKKLKLHTKVHRDYTKLINKFQYEVRDYLQEEIIQYSDAIIAWNRFGKVQYQELYPWNSRILNSI
jgi:molybdenum cofactor biosynthesis enzyme MoaA